MLQISAWQDAIPYLSGAPDPSRLPVARALRGGLFGGAAEQVEALAAEHTDFVRSNCVGQLEAYVGWAEGRCADLGVGPAQRAPLKALQSGAGATGTAQRVVSAIRCGLSNERVGDCGCFV